MDHRINMFFISDKCSHRGSNSSKHIIGRKLGILFNFDIRFNLFGSKYEDYSYLYDTANWGIKTTFTCQLNCQHYK